MTRRKRKHPHRHTGKAIPVRTIEQIAADHVSIGDEKVSIDFWRDAVLKLQQAELAMVHNRTDAETYKQRTAVLAECMTWLDWFENRVWRDEAGNLQPVSAEDAELLAHNAIRVGLLIGRAEAAIGLEPWAGDGYEHSERARQNLDKHRQAKGPAVGHAELLRLCREFYRLHQCARRKLAEHVATKLPIGRDRVLQLVKQHGIKKADYIA